MAISWQAIYVLWLREMKGMWRAKSRAVGEELLNLSLTQQPLHKRKYDQLAYTTLWSSV
jgi:hypothetical protein